MIEKCPSVRFREVLAIRECPLQRFYCNNSFSEKQKNGVFAFYIFFVTRDNFHTFKKNIFSREIIKGATFISNTLKLSIHTQKIWIHISNFTI